MIVVNGFSLSNRAPDLSHERELRIDEGAVGIFDHGTVFRVLVLNLEAAKARGDSGLKRCPRAKWITPDADRAIPDENVKAVTTVAASLCRPPPLTLERASVIVISSTDQACRTREDRKSTR